MKKRILSAIITLCMVLTMLPMAIFASYGKPTGLNISSSEWEVLRYTNIERAKENLPLLVTFNDIQQCAGIRSDELNKDYRSDHTRPDDRICFTVFDDNDFSYTVAGENIGYIQGYGDAKAIVTAWMNSPGHRANIMNAEYRYLGAGNTNEFWEQLFASDEESTAKSIAYDEQNGYFIITLENGQTAYAPYDEDSSPYVNGEPEFNYPLSNAPQKEEPITQKPEKKDDKPKLSVLPKNGKFGDKWFYICSEDGSKFHVNGNSVEGSKLYKTKFQAEFLGNDEYNIKTEDGRYLIPGEDLGKAYMASKRIAILAVSTTPFKWRIASSNNLTRISYAIHPVNNSFYYLRHCPSEQASKVYLSYEPLTLPTKCLFDIEFVKEASTVRKHPFTDVPIGCEYEDALMWVIEKNITQGTSATTFSPDMSLTRSQVATFLWRAFSGEAPIDEEDIPDWLPAELRQEKPEIIRDNPFTDVSKDAWYKDAVLWAVEMNITSGTSKSTFSPDKTCTKAEALTFLYRSVEEDIIPPTNNPVYKKYQGKYYDKAISWAHTNGLINALDGKFNPDDKATRADTIFYLYQGLNYGI